jgi:molybdate transport system substrate-binding protein
MFHRIAVAISIAVALVFAVATAGAAELKVMGAGPVEGTVKELLPAFVRETGHKVEGVFNTVGIIQDRLKAGERPDILILSAPVMEAMEKDGSLVAGSRTEVGRATSGFAVRAGAPTPDISTPDAMKKTLLAARTVAYVDPAGGGTTGIIIACILFLPQRAGKHPGAQQQSA